ncbi:hypothetical protein Tco_0126436 [Tanacetum coccineum]
MVITGLPKLIVSLVHLDDTLLLFRKWIFKKRNKKKAKSKQIQARNKRTKSKVKPSEMNIQLEAGLTTAKNHKLYCKEKGQGPKLPTGRD